MTRVGWIDALRALAILLMVVFHFCYDLRYFGYVDWGVPNGPGWWQFRYLILTLFLGTVGVSLSLAHGAGVRWPSFWRRLLKISLAALAITLMSLQLFPNAWIYFGILHFIVLASLLCVWLVAYPRLALGLGLSLLILYWMSALGPGWPFVYFARWLPDTTEDFVPLFPWLGVVAMGVWLGAQIRAGKWRFPALNPPAWVSFCARHALLIYLLHQPLLFGGFLLVNQYA